MHSNSGDCEKSFIKTFVDSIACSFYIKFIIKTQKKEKDEGVHIRSHWSGRYSGRQCLLGTLLPRTWHSGMIFICTTFIWYSFSTKKKIIMQYIPLTNSKMVKVKSDNFVFLMNIDFEPLDLDARFICFRVYMYYGISSHTLSSQKKLRNLSF